MEWFGLPKSLTFNRLKVSTETTIKLNTTYLLRCKFDPLYYLPLRNLLGGCLGSLYCIGPTLVMAVGSPLVVLPTIVAVGYSHQCIDPCCYTLSRGPSSLPITSIGCIRYNLIVPTPSVLTCQDFKEQALKPLCCFNTASIGGWPPSFQAPLWNIFKKSEGKSF